MFAQAVLAMYGIIFVVGVASNAALVRYVLGHWSPRSASNVFLCNLALGDLLLLLTCVPVDATRFLSRDWLFGRTGCKLLPFFQLVSVGVSVFTLTALSADRYNAIVKPMERAPPHPVRNACLRAIAIWLLSSALAVPDILSSEVSAVRVFNTTFFACMPFSQGEILLPRLHAFWLFIVYYSLPLITIAVFYARISKELCRSANHLPSESTGNHWHQQVEGRKRLAKTVLVFVLLFATCLLPNHIVYLYRSFRTTKVPDTSRTHLFFVIFARVLCFCHACVNPLALYAISSAFRTSVAQQVCCRQRPTGRQIERTPRCVRSSRRTESSAMSIGGEMVALQHGVQRVL
uniref:gastrin-releasing peptide receptor-like n=1 Tax=Myxine glutinosa TaxID=7769 RepID=UPI00358F0597